MRMRILVVGRCKPEFDEIVYKYLKRIHSPWHIGVVPIRAVARSASGNVEDVILLDENGKTFGSREWSKHLQHLTSKLPDLALIIGGPGGHAPVVRARAVETWSLSSLIFSMVLRELY